MSWVLSITVQPAEVDSVADRLWELGTSGIAVDGSQVTAGFESVGEAETAGAELGGVVTAVDPTAWDGPARTRIEIGDRTIAIDAGQSFGHGNHPTTRLCLQALEKHLRPGQGVLDVGCGSGVLSLAASALGAGAITAIDIDPVAVAVTAANATANQVELDVSSADITELTGPFDVVVANMLIAEVQAIAHDIGRLASEMVIIGGALVGQRDRVLAALAPWATLVDEAVAGEWLGATFRIEDR